jgi:uncharacterized membrane protein YeaQ/YmgE (transglycosylase-associated protein family)
MLIVLALVGLFALFMAIKIVGLFFALIPALLVGLFAGWVASQLLGGHLGFIRTAVLGIAGSFIGTLLFALIHLPHTGLGHIVAAVVGATVVLAGVRAISGGAVPATTSTWR